MQTNLIIALTFVMSLCLLIGTSLSIGWLITASVVMVGITNFSLLLYLALSTFSLVGVTSNYEEISLEDIQITKDEVIETLELLDNPFYPRIYNVGILTTFVVSVAHIGSIVFTFTTAMMILYISAFMINKKIMEKLYNLTLD